MTVLASLLLADSRVPTSGHARIGGVEAAVERGLLRDEADLALFVAGRLRGSAPVLAAAAAAGCLLAADLDSEWGRWDGAVSARIPSAATREASRAQGTALLHTARRAWPCAALEVLCRAGRPHHPLVLGAVVAATGDGADAAGLLAVHHLLGGACAAAVRLLGLDPIAVAVVQARASLLAEQVAQDGARVAREAVAQRDPPCCPAPAPRCRKCWPNCTSTRR